MKEMGLIGKIFVVNFDFQGWKHDAPGSSKNFDLAYLIIEFPVRCWPIKTPKDYILLHYDYKRSQTTQP
jgi:hypothetical protein